MKKIVIILLISIQGFSQNFDYKNYGNLLAKYVSSNGNVNYELLQKNAAELNQVIIGFESNYPTKSWAKEEILAYYINAYNVYTLKKVVDNYPTKSIKNINNAWDDKFIVLGKKRVSLSYIEHGILRKMNEPRIHFAINCASFSCPQLANVPYLPATLDTQLDKAARNFINDGSKNSITTDEIKISEIFNWFSGDFKTNATDIIDYINRYAAVKVDANAKIRYLKYNWSLNE